MRRRSKYRAVRTNGYASKLEAAYAAELHLLAEAGAVTNLAEQVRVPLVAGITYIPDFAYTQPDGVRVWVDVKGVETGVFRLKARLWKAYGPGPLQIVKKAGKGFVVARTIAGGGQA